MKFSVKKINDPHYTHRVEYFASPEQEDLVNQWIDHSKIPCSRVSFYRTAIAGRLVALHLNEQEANLFTLKWS